MPDAGLAVAVGAGGACALVGFAVGWLRGFNAGRLADDYLDALGGCRP